MIAKAKQFFIETLQKALNSYLALDVESGVRLQQLSGKLVALELSRIDVTFYLLFSDNKAQLSFSTDDQPETIIIGTPLRLMMLALSPRANRKQFFADDVEMIGNPVLGQQVIDLFDQLNIDWEDYLARFVGDVPAHYAGSMLRNFKTWTTNTHETLRQNLNEYLHEEITLFPPVEALQDFFQDVDKLRMDVDRIEARIRHLQSMVKNKQGNP
jgi:ubiquinone biosynthesis accessory factor UbiJ